MTNDTSPGPGILQPMLQHRWRFTLVCRDKEIQDLIRQQVVRCQIDYKSQTIAVTVEQNVFDAKIHEALIELGRNTAIGSAYGEPIPNLSTVFIDTMDGADGVFFSLRFFVTLQSHSFDLDYGKNGAATHEITFKIHDMIPYERKK